MEYPRSNSAIAQLSPRDQITLKEELLSNLDIESANRLDEMFSRGNCNKSVTVWIPEDGYKFMQEFGAPLGLSVSNVFRIILKVFMRENSTSRVNHGRCETTGKI